MVALLHIEMYKEDYTKRLNIWQQDLRIQAISTELTP